ncbi:MAG: TetR family transcriptional regulator [Proteobacteria bacterium]|nr:TetR family transcriptional regulator [Pseudomonadota bacterium]
MARRRRSAEEARGEILDAAEALLLADGPEAVRIRAVAEAVGISHPGVLHHFGSVDQLLEALHRRAGRRLREELLASIPTDASPEAIGAAVASAFERLRDPREGRLLAWLVATGRDPFPPEEEHGLEVVAQALHGQRGPDTELDETRYVVMLGLLAMYGDALVGDGVRRRVGLDEDAGAGFRPWLLRLLGRELQGR